MLSYEKYKMITGNIKVLSFSWNNLFNDLPAYWVQSTLDQRLRDAQRAPSAGIVV